MDPNPSQTIMCRLKRRISSQGFSSQASSSPSSSQHPAVFTEMSPISPVQYSLVISIFLYRVLAKHIARDAYNEGARDRFTSKFTHIYPKKKKFTPILRLLTILHTLRRGIFSLKSTFLLVLIVSILTFKRSICLNTRICLFP